MSNAPSNLRYTDDHEWLLPDGNSWRVGITQFAVSQLGDITIVELPAVGKEVSKGERFGTIESVKSVSELYAPVSGKITAVNTELNDSPEDVNSEPYGDGWLIEIEPSNKDELGVLMTPEAYDQHVAAQ